MPEEKRASEKLWIREIVKGEFEKREGSTNVLKLETGRKVTTVRILGTVVDKFVAEGGDYAVITIDDSTETIRVKLFKEEIDLLRWVKVGSLVDVIGRLREYEDEIYISPIAVHKLEDPNWELLRNFEILQKRLGKEEGKKEPDVDLEPMVIKKVEELDDGDGARFKEIINDLKDHREDNVVDALKKLMAKGELYEPKKERLKRVK